MASRLGVPIPQLVCDAPAVVRPGPESVPLTEAHRSDMLALTALVFPGFFRVRTVEMGRYIGIYHGRVLAAMAGERMRMDGFSGDQRRLHASGVHRARLRADGSSRCS